MATKKIVIVGGGNAGLSVASKLLIKNKELDITIIDPSEKHYYQPAWTLVGAGIYDVNDTIKAEKDYIPKGTTWVKEAVSEFLPEKNTVACKNGVSYEYDVLIVAPGIQLDWQKIKGFKETLGKNEVSCNYSVTYAPYTWEMIRNFKGGNAVFTNPSTPIKCGGAPHKIMYLACDYWRKKGILDKTNVYYVSGGSMIFGIPEYAATLNKVIAEDNIHPIYNSNVVEIDGDKKMLYYEQKDEAGVNMRKELKFDLCHAVPPQSAPDFVKNSPLADAKNPYGYVEVDMHTLQHSRFPNVFSLGDACSAPASKTGAAIRKQAPVVVENILSFLNGQPATARYEGYSACPIPTKYGKLMLAEFDYSNKPKMTFPFNQAKPRWTMWMLKTKVLPWLYWHKILKGTA
ncbi:MAG: NAD(P)/FAD-dependent oxidoreductase [Chitinophagaceae bacterium]|nr:NAD(P)/FAD-dependent oxidoreductase [Chitinophagaceae bacterium]